MFRLSRSTPEIEAVLAGHYYLAYRRRLLAVARNRLGQSGDCEDALHEAFVGVIAHFGGLNLACSPVPYLARSVRHSACHVLLDKNARHLPFDEALHDGGRIAPRDGNQECRLIIAELQRELGRAFPPEDRRLFELCYIDGVDRGTAAGMAGISCRSLFRKLGRMRRRLRQHIREAPGVDAGVRPD